MVYLDRKPGFYKKGPLQFKLHFGTIEEIIEKANEPPELSSVPAPESEAPDEDGSSGPDNCA